MRGRTGICIFEGILEATKYTEILEETLLPFVSDIYPEGHKLMADNDPKHTSRCAKNFIAERGINWLRTPAESPDLNPSRVTRPQSHREPLARAKGVHQEGGKAKDERAAH